MDIDVNIAHCIQTINSIGHTTYVNICHGGSAVVVPWGGADWVGCAAIGLLVLGLTAILGTLAFVMMEDLLGF